MEASLLRSYADEDSMSHGKKPRNPKKNTNQTHRSMIPPSTNNTSGNLYFENNPKMGMILNPPCPFPMYSSSSLARTSSCPYSPHQFYQPPLLPLPTAASFTSSSSYGTNKKLYNKVEQRDSAKQAPNRPHKSSNHKTKKSPDLKPDLGATKRLGPDPESGQPMNATKEMKFCESVIYAMAPPPSSLPMPKFSKLKPELISCKVAR